MPRVHVISGHVDDGLLAEVFSNEGIGTLVYANEYQQIRRARRADMRAIMQLIRASIESEELAPRTRATIERELGDYYIFEVDKNPIACVALHLYPEERKGELACLYVRSSHENQGIGRKMTQFVEAKAREPGSRRCSRSRRRPSTTSSRRPASSRARPTTCRPRAARATTRAAGAPRCC